MGLFKHKEKARPDLLSPNPPAPNASNSPSQNGGQHNNSFNDSTYYSTSDLSNGDAQKANSNLNRQQAQGKPPGTTVTTTTTTTTTVTTVTSDGTTQTESHPYNPLTDPPQQSYVEESPELRRSQPISLDNPTQVQSHTPVPQTTQQTSIYEPPVPDHQNDRPSYSRMQTPPRKPVPQAAQELPVPINHQYNDIPPIPQESNTIGGRKIPSKSDLRSSGPPVGAVGAVGSIPARSERRRSQELTVPPLRTGNHSPHHHNASIDSAISTDPVSPIAREDAPNFSRPGVTGGSKRENLMQAAKGLHGAGEALRGTVNHTLAKGIGDKAEQERARIVREDGMNEFRGSGLREGFREKAEGRMRLKRRSGGATNLGSAPQGLHQVDEASV